MKTSATAHMKSISSVVASQEMSLMIGCKPSANSSVRPPMAQGFSIKEEAE
jgi:hypothetical protein